MRSGLCACFVVSVLRCFFNGPAALGQVDISNKGAGAYKITIFKPASLSAAISEFSVLPPDKNDPQTVLSIAAAFTTKSSGISGVAVCNGKKIVSSVNPHLTGTAIFLDGNFQIFSNDHGRVLTPAFIAAVEESGGSLFQQFMLVKDGIAQPFKDLSLAPRRALAILEGGDRVVVQSGKPMTLIQFARQMQSIGVRSALYTPVADADGGWYRDGDRTVSIGSCASSIPVQSNWVLWRKDGSVHEFGKVDEWLLVHKHSSASK